MSSSKAIIEEFKNPIAQAWEEGMVASHQVSIADTQILNPTSMFYSTLPTSATASPINPGDLKANLTCDIEHNENAEPSERIFTFEGFFDVGDLRVPSTVSSNGLFSTTPNGATSPYYVSPRTIQPGMLNTADSVVSTPASKDSDGLSSPSPHTPEDMSNTKKKLNGGRKRKAESMEEKEARAKERVLRNRHAAQMSRDKKRRQLADLEAQNALLKEENGTLCKRIKVVEDENAALSTKLEAISAQLSEIQSHLAVSEVTKFLLDGVRGSAASATLEQSVLSTNDGKEEKKYISNTPSEKVLFQHSSRPIDFVKERSKKSQQRHVKMRNLYGTSTSQAHSSPIWMLPSHILKQLLLTLSIVFWTTTGQQRFYLQFNNKRMEFVNDVVISDLVRRYNQKRWLRSVKVKRGRGASKLRLVPRDWRKYPP